MKRVLNLIISLTAGFTATVMMPAQATETSTTAGQPALISVEKRSSFKPVKRHAQQQNRPAYSKTSVATPGNVRSLDLPVIYGNVIDSYELPNLGLYQLPQSEGDVFKSILPGIEGERGGVALDGVYYVTAADYEAATVRGYSLESGEVVYEAEVTYEQVPITLCLNPADNRLYGIFNSEDNVEGYVFAIIDYSSATPELTPIGTVPFGMYTCLSCDATGNMYVLRDLENDYYEIYDSEFLKVNTASGELTYVGRVGYFSEYDTSACIDPVTGRMFYAVCTYDKCGLVEINTKTGEGTELMNFPNSEEIVGMFCPTPKIDEKAPAAVENFRLNFTEGNLSGAVSFTIPSTLFDGTPSSGEVEYHVSCNGEEKTGNARPGTDVNVEFTLPESAKYAFRVFLSNESGDGPVIVTESFIGEDIPALTGALVASYDNGTMTLDWEKPVVGIYGGYIAEDKIKFRISQLSPEEIVLEESTGATSYRYEMEAPESKTVFEYAVTMSYGAEEIVTVKSNSVVLGSLLPPYAQNFGTPEAMNDMSVLDVNGDGKTWNYFSGCVRIESDAQHSSDDWIFLPGIKLSEGGNYKISWRAWCASMGCPEKLEIKIGAAPSPEAMSTAILEPTVIRVLQEDAVLAASSFEPASTGIYYIGFHAMSDADSFYLYLSDISVTRKADADAPAAPEDFAVVPDAMGNPEVEISFVVPAVEALDAVKVLCDEDEIKLFEAPVAGQKVVFTHQLSSCGDYTFAAFSVKGGVESDPVTFTVYCGPGMPGAVTGVNIHEVEIGKVLLTWNPVDVNIFGSQINPELVKYNIFRISNHQVTDVIENNYTGTEITLSPVFEDKQDFVRYAVYGVTDKGQGVGMESDMIPIGESYHNFAESFADGQLTYVFGVNTVNDGQIDLYNDDYLDGINSQDSDNGFLVIYGLQEGQAVELSSGKISIEGMKIPTLELWLHNYGEEDLNVFAVDVRVPEEEFINRLSINPPAAGTEKWNLIRIPLTDIESKDAQFRIRGTIKNFGSIGIDNMRVYDAGEQGVESAIASEIQVLCTKGSLRILGGEGAVARIMTVAGISRTVELTGDLTLPLAPGVYFIAVGTLTYKILVH